MNNETDDIIERMEKLGAKTLKRPRVLLNDTPLDLSLNQSLLISPKRSVGKSNFSLPDMDWQSTYYSHASQPILKSYNEKPIDIKDICNDLRSIPFCRSQNTSFVSLPECEINSSGYGSGRSSTFYKSHDESAIESGHSFSLPEIAAESSAYGSDNESSLYIYHRRAEPKRRTPNGHWQEPSTSNIERESMPKTFDLDDLDCGLLPMLNVTSSPVTSSTIKTIDFDNLVEPDDLNDTLERVNYRLAICGAKSPSPTKMARKRQLMREFADELLKQEATIKVKKSACNVVMPPPTKVKSVPIVNKGLEIINVKTAIINEKSPAKYIEKRLNEMGCVEPTLYKTAKRKQLIEELIKKTKSPKRTISVDQIYKEVSKNI